VRQQRELREEEEKGNGGRDAKGKGWKK